MSSHSAEAPDPRYAGRADLPIEHQAADSATLWQVSSALGCQPCLKRSRGMVAAAKCNQVGGLGKAKASDQIFGDSKG